MGNANTNQPSNQHTNDIINHSNDNNNNNDDDNGPNTNIRRVTFRIPEIQPSSSNPVSNLNQAQQLSFTINTNDQQPRSCLRSTSTLTTANNDQPSSSTIINTTDCQICFEVFPSQVIFSADGEHKFCIPCITKYLRRIAKKGRPYPFICPSCRTPMENEKCLKAVSADIKVYRELEQLIIHKEHMRRVRYCANPHCAMPFDWLPIGDTNDIDQMEEYQVRISCPFCYKETCARCRCEWHTEKTCVQNSKDISNRRLRASRVPCPDCGHMIEKRPGGCNFIRCICGCGFCYLCGNEYKSRERTPGNIHGTPGCNCRLFNRTPVLAQARAVAPQRALPIEMIQRDEDDPAKSIRGPNGFVNLNPWMKGDDNFPMPMPMKMIQSIRRLHCPYEQCDIPFENIAELHEHLAFTVDHVVYLCCSRPFYTYACFSSHRLVTNCRKRLPSANN